MSEASAPSGHYRRAVDRLMRLADFERVRTAPRTAPSGSIASARSWSGSATRT